MGFADTLIKLGIFYDSQASLDFIDQVGKVYKETTDAINPDDFHFYHRIIAPTGSLSILADCSSGIEPIFADTFERNLTIGKIEETRDLYKSEYVRIAHEITPEWHIKVQAQWQKWLDGSCSKTINMNEFASVDDIKNAYKLAWQSGCKGITIFRDESKETQVLTKKTKPKCSDGECTL
jgi:ribonucleoside-diphosphate reductase alpha chain